MMLVVILLFSFNLSFSQEMEKEAELIVNAINTENYDNFFQNFSSLFRKQLPDEQFKTILKDIKIKYGNVISKKLISENNNYAIYEFVFERYTMKVSISKDNSGKINTLFFSDIVEKNDFEVTLKNIKELNFRKSFLVKDLKTNEEIFGINKIEQLPIASAFKMYILASIEKEDIPKIIILDRKHYSIPPFMLHNWPERYPVTISTLLFLMISKSDNTATDHLINYLGKEKNYNYI